MLQLEIDDDYMEALQEIAKSHKESRRKYWADYLVKVCDSIPGLMDKIRAQRAINYNVPTPQVEMGKPEEERTSWTKDEIGGFKDHFNTVKGYRFFYLDEEKGFIDGYGTGAQKALIDATGRSWTPEEYYEVFRSVPGYVDGEKKL